MKLVARDVAVKLRARSPILFPFYSNKKSLRVQEWGNAVL